jgi:D-alanyl-D-alanine carboxypeptidase
MKYSFFAILLLVGCTDLDLSTTATACRDTANNSYARGSALQEIIARYTKLGIPGISMAVRHGSTRWEGAAGFASIEQRMAMQPCHLLYSQSVAKVYTAVTILQLKEEGKIDLDQSIRLYLPEKIWKRIEHSDVITPRMLLNHTSGVFDYAYDYGSVTYLLNNGDRVWSQRFLLDFILDKKPLFFPGTRYSYSNSGYTLLAVMAEHVSGKKHAQLIREKILSPAGLLRTFYKDEIPAVVDQGLVNSYFDRFSDGRLENISQPQLNNILSMMGDDSIVATSRDYVDFLDALARGVFLSGTTMTEMKTWVNNSKGKPAYGLGLAYHLEGEQWGFGHAGGGLGAGCILYHFPEKDVTVFLGVNMCTLLEGPATDQIEKMRKEIFDVLFQK